MVATDGRLDPGEKEEDGQRKTVSEKVITPNEQKVRATPEPEARPRLVCRLLLADIVGQRPDAPLGGRFQVVSAESSSVEISREVPARHRPDLR